MLSYLGTVVTGLLEEFHKYFQLNYHPLRNDHHGKSNWRRRTPYKKIHPAPSQLFEKNVGVLKIDQGSVPYFPNAYLSYVHFKTPVKKAKVQKTMN